MPERDLSIARSEHPGVEEILQPWAARIDAVRSHQAGERPVTAEYVRIGG
jgi:hypothetical protein